MTYIPPKRSAGTIQTQRRKLPWPKDKPFRILSIDGGGICGILPAAVLSELEARYLGGDPVTRHFDMVAGTSTGGIIALGLGAGLRASDALQLYMEHGAEIFPRGNVFQRAIKNARHKFRFIYDDAVLEERLRKTLGNRVLGQSVTRLVVPSFEGRHGEPWIYKTPHHSDYKNDLHEQMVNVGMATSAAPTYYRAFEKDHYVYIDGGIWANNPVMNAIVDALACYDIERRQIQVLSIGCGETVHRVTPSMKTAGMWGWRFVIQAAIRAQSKNALGQAFLLLGKDNVLRLDAPESSRSIKLDDYTRASADLPPMANSLVEAAGQQVASQFFRDVAQPYAPEFYAVA